MPTRMVLSVAFVIAVVLGMLLYIINDPARADYANQTTIEKKSEEGAILFAQNCSQCHGPLGEGGVGPAINRPEWHPGDPKFDATSTYDFIKRVLVRGQYSPQPGINMPAWAKENNGPWNEQQIDDVITFLIYGDWRETLRNVSTPNYNADLPVSDDLKAKYPKANENSDEGKKQLAAQTAELNDIKKLMLNKGCLNCHAIGSAGATLGPALTVVGSRRSADWMTRWIKDPSKIGPEERASNYKPWFDQYAEAKSQLWPINPTYMPTIAMTDEERAKIVNYLANLKLAPNALQQEQQQKASQPGAPQGSPSITQATPTATPNK